MNNQQLKNRVFEDMLKGAETYETKINGNKSVVSIKDNKTIIVTKLSEKTFTLIGEIDKDTAIKIMQSVKLKK